MTQILATGLAMGCIYALVGLGFILIYNATTGLNFAQGELVMLGAFVFYSMVSTGAPYAGAALATVVLMGLAGYVFQLLLFHPLRNRSFLAFIIATIGFSIFARNLALLIWGPFPLKAPSLFSRSTVEIGDVVLTPEHIFIIGTTMIVLLLQYGLFFHTDLGRRLRATAQNAEVAQLMGVRAGPDDRDHLRAFGHPDRHRRRPAGADLPDRHRDGAQPDPEGVHRGDHRRLRQHPGGGRRRHHRRPARRS